ncbi:MAG TPA: gliding motility-associated protein GldE [Cytophagales bacterium]|nr:gliding motility-associated protein GldE [Cytophagales bacterium]HAA23424.1 gliding motility-associated protein GldE [Cytophagales bacterium]HAP58619.1 gliding motility-associated protein GldE [Cytophagales bacterium]
MSPGYMISISIALLILLVASALVSGSEVAFFSLRKDELESQPNQPSVSRVQWLLKKPQRLLATILILNNFINVAIVTLSTFLTWSITGAESASGWAAVILVFATTFAIVFFGEVVPKVFATQYNLRFAKFMSQPLMFANQLFRPLSWILMSLSRIIEKRIERKGYEISVNELQQAVELTAEGEASEEEKDILKGIVNFGTITVKQIMRSRMDIVAFDVELNFHELMDKVNKNSYSRIPVFEETIDHLEGILYIKDLLPHLDHQEDFKWQTLLRPTYFVPENKKIDSLLRDFQEKRVHMAIVVDEYGGTSGLITLEDIIEEIVGEINDEFDEEDIAYNRLDENTFVFEGKTSLNDFTKVVNIDPTTFDEVKGDSESLGGLLLELNSTLPRSGEKITYERFVFTVVAVDPKRIKKIRVFINRSQVAE